MARLLLEFSVFTSSQANYSAENKVTGLGQAGEILQCHCGGALAVKSCITELKNSCLRCGGYELKQPQLVAM